MSALGSLVVKLALEYAEYTQGLDKSSQAALMHAKNVQRNFDSAEKSAKQYFSRIATGAVAAVAAYAGINAAIDRLSNSINTLAKLDDMAQKTGSSVENLSRIQKTVAAFGGDFGAVDNAIAKLAKGMGTIDSDTNKANNALKALGISSRDTAGNLRDPSQVMIEIARNLQNYADGAGKTALATDLFGKSGAEIMPVLNDMADNISRFSGVSTEAAQQASLLKDQMGLMSGHVDSLYTSMALNLMPALTDIAGAMNNTSTNTVAFTATADAAGIALKGLVTAGSLVGYVFTQVGTAIGAAAAMADRFAHLDFSGVKVIKDAFLSDAADNYASLGKFIGDVWNGSSEVAKQTSKINTPAVAKPALNYQSGAAAASASDAKAAINAYDKLIGSIHEKTAAQALELSGQAKLTDGQKTALDAMVKLRDGTLNLTSVQKIKLTGDLENLLTTEQSVTAMQAAKKAADDLIQSGQRQITGVQGQLDALREQNAMIGMSNEQIIALTGSKNEELAANLRSAAVYAGPLHDAYIQHANDLDALAQLQRDLVKEQQIAKAGEDWSRMWSTMEQTGRMAFVQFAAHGTSAMASIGQSIKMSIIDLLYQLTVRKWIINIGTSLSGSFAAGAANAAGGSVSGGGISLMNIASSASNVFSAVTGGLTSTLGSGIAGLGSMFGSSAVSAFGAGLAGSTAGIFSAAGGAGTAFIGGAGTAIGGAGMGAAATIGASLAAMAGPAIALIAVDLVFRKLAGDKVIGGGVGKVLNYVPVLGPMLNTMFGRGPFKPAGPQELVGQFDASGFEGDLQQTMRSKGGWFRKNRYRVDHTALSEDTQQGLSSVVATASAIYADLIQSADEGARSLAGWTYSVRRQIDSEEKIKQLTIDVSNSLGMRLVPELAAVQQKGEQLTDTAKRMRSEFILTTELIDLTGQSFGALGLASTVARDNLIQLFGGVDKAAAPLQAYYQSFYTDAERNASGWRLLNHALSNLGLTTLPATLDQYRALTEAQDLSTNAGQGMFSALVQLAPAFASLTNATEQLGQGIVALTEDYFATLTDYIRYQHTRQTGSNTLLSQTNAFRPPGFASGGNFAGGLRIVGENGPELEATGPSRIISNNELMAKLRSPDAGNAAFVAEIRQLRAELKKTNDAIARHVSATADMVRRWDNDGMPAVRTV
ncbi:MAG: hypothetical protein H0Z53_00785 [Nitrosospira sp.]|nr:hypothetical protein [Nitrosospira sp.]